MAKKNKGAATGLSLKQSERLTAGLTDHEHPAVAPDGTLFACYAGEYGSIQIYVFDSAGRLARCVSPGGNNTQPAWHPKGDRIAFRHQESTKHKWEIWESPLFEGTPARCLLADKKWHYKHPSYSPDGKRIAYFSDEGSAGIFHIWELSVKSGKRKQLTSGDNQNQAHPVYSPDGTRIVYHAYEGTDESRQPPVTNLYELELNGGKVRALTTAEDQYKHPFYVNDTLITYHHERNRDGRRWIEAMDLTSGAVFLLTTGKNNDKHPFPWVDKKGRRFVYWASKKLGKEREGEPNTYDIFRARLAGKAVAPKGKSIEKSKSKGSGKKDKGSGKKDKPARDRPSKLAVKIVDKVCGTCPAKPVAKGTMTSWKQARELGVKGKSKACKDCPARDVLG